MPRNKPQNAALALGRTPRATRNRNRKTSGPQIAPLIICGQSVVPT